jgi:hypothetical protein
MTELETINAFKKLNVKQIMNKLKDGTISTIQEHKIAHDILNSAAASLNNSVDEKIDDVKYEKELKEINENALNITSSDIDKLFG